MKIIVYNIQYNKKESYLNIVGPDALFQFEKSIELKNQGQIDRLYGIENSSFASADLVFDVPFNSVDEIIMHDDYIKQIIKEKTGYTPESYRIRTC